jgi:hydroxypyruvate reductase
MDGRDLRADALSIWRVGLDAVRSDALVHAALRLSGNHLVVKDLRIDLNHVRRILVVGAGKAGAGMAAAVEEVLGPFWLRSKQVTGWVNVPADCVRPLATIHLHPARPPGRNEPAPDGVYGSEEILRLVAGCAPGDLCLCLISGGASALLPAPREGVTLADKLAVTRFLSAAGANIRELNTVRKHLSRIKGGGLLRACRAGRLISLVISDVIGDPLDLIGSGPTVPDASTPAEALQILNKYRAAEAGISSRVFNVLRRSTSGRSAPTCTYHNFIIGNNALAVEAAGRAAVRLGCQTKLKFAADLEGPAEEVGRWHAAQALAMRAMPGPNCLITGGEPVVELVPEDWRGLGGRNQQLVLAALDALRDDGACGIALLSAATDGEDGPTDAAGAMLDARILESANRLGLNAADYLRRNDAYRFFEPLDGLIKTGPTHTNVCDLRVVTVDRGRQSPQVDA